MTDVEFTLKELASLLEVECSGDSTVIVKGIATLQSAESHHLSLYHNPRYLQDLQTTHAGAVILSEKTLVNYQGNALVTENPYVCFAKATQLFKKRTVTSTGVHSSAQVHPSVELGSDVVIGPNVVVESGVKIGNRSVVNANSIIASNVVLGTDCWLHPNVSIYEGCELGRRSIVHSGAVIGSDGFGFAFDGNDHIKIEQLGRVIIGDDVEIGAGTTIDRGALDNTLIANGVKIDNQVQIAHNVTIGEKTVICGCSAIAGSAKIGAHCIIAGAVGVINHVTIVDGVTVTAMSLVNQDIKEKGVYSSGTGLTETSLWRRNIVRFKELDTMAKQLKRLDKNEN